jgi:peroxiredoxin (alkyl hydroperoxide reductase subunit C)
MKKALLVASMLVFIVLGTSCMMMHHPHRPGFCCGKEPGAPGKAGNNFSVRIPLIGDKAPAFEAVTTQGKIKFPEDYKGKWVILFSHPADFTPVCTTEFMTFGYMADQFDKLNCKLIGLSIDSKFSHIAWLREIAQKIEFNGMKNVKVKFPVIADLSMDVAKKYGMVQPQAHATHAVRAVFFIDPETKIRAIIYYPLENGRNFDEIKRILIAMQTSDKFKCATPANWQPGDPVIIPPPGSCGQAADRVKQADQQGYKCLDWFLCLKQLPFQNLGLPEGVWTLEK